MTVLTNLKSLGEVMLAALILGAGLPIVFALGVRLWSAADTVGPARHRTAARVGAFACLVAVVAAVLAGVLFIAKEFLAHRLGIHVFGQA